MLQTSSTHNSKKILIRFLNVLIVCIIIMGLLWVANNVTKRRDADVRIGEFIEEDQEYDVLFFGSSHMLYGVNPMQLWAKYGITSYNLAGPATWTMTSCEILKNAIQIHRPKVAVLEVFGTNMPQDPAFLHNTFDAFTLSLQKINSVNTIIEDEAIREEIIIPFSLYHSRWDEIQWPDIEEGLEIEKDHIKKGSVFAFTVYQNAEEIQIDYTHWKLNDKMKGRQQKIIKFIEICNQEEVIPLLLYLPYNVIDNDDIVSSVAEEYGVHYVDLYEKGGTIIDYQTDLQDHAHLNFAGESKVTEYIGKELLKVIPGNIIHDEKYQIKWDKYYEEYKRFILSTISNARDVNTVLLCLQDEAMKTEVSIGSGWYENEIVMHFIQQSNNIQEIKKNNAKENEIYFYIYDSITNELLAQKTLSM